MRTTRIWLGLLGLALIVGVLVFLEGPSASADSPEHSSTSDAAGGTSALRLFAATTGHSVGAVQGQFVLPGQSGLLFVFTPTTPIAASEANQIGAWVRRGGVLIYAAEMGDPQLDQLLNIRRVVPNSSTPVAIALDRSTTPILVGVQELAGNGDPILLRAARNQVPLVRHASSPVVQLQNYGTGKIVTISDPLPLCNAYLGLANNGRFAADLLALTPAGGPILFDEYHHGVVAGAGGANWMTTPWGLALLLAVALLFGGLALRGIAFGPPQSLVRGRGRSSAEYAAAVGGLLERAQARRATLDTLLRATRQRVGEQVRLPRDPDTQSFLPTLAVRAPDLAEKLTAASTEAAAVAGDPAMTKVAERLHDLAYPLGRGSRG